MDDEVKIVAIIASAIVSIVLIIALTWLASQKIAMTNGYEAASLPGHSMTAWVKVREPVDK